MNSKKGHASNWGRVLSLSFNVNRKIFSEVFELSEVSDYSEVSDLSDYSDYSDFLSTLTAHR